MGQTCPTKVDAPPVLLALGFGEVSVVIPLAGTAPLFVLLLTVLFLGGEQLSGRIVVGAVLIVLGVFLLTGVKHRLAGGCGGVCFVAETLWSMALDDTQGRTVFSRPPTPERLGNG
jgi:drug/metabolite transporter (DMT)-like permease